jgi:hypothetical protein
VEILNEIGKQSPILAVLVFFIWYFMKQLEKKDKRIEDLSKFILDEQKEYAEQLREDQKIILEAMNGVAKTITELTQYLKYERKK